MRGKAGIQKNGLPPNTLPFEWQPVLLGPCTSEHPVIWGLVRVVSPYLVLTQSIDLPHMAQVTSTFA